MPYPNPLLKQPQKQSLEKKDKYVKEAQKSPNQRSPNQENQRLKGPRQGEKIVYNEDGTPQWIYDERPSDANRICHIETRTTKKGETFLRVSIYDENTGAYKFSVNCWKCSNNYKSALKNKVLLIPDFEGKRKDVSVEILTNKRRKNDE